MNNTSEMIRGYLINKFIFCAVLSSYPVHLGKLLVNSALQVWLDKIIDGKRIVSWRESKLSIVTTII